MTQIPPRGTPEFEEYKKQVEEAHRNGAKIESSVMELNEWHPNTGPGWNWFETDYRIAPNQPQSLHNQQQEPSMTSTEQRIVKALDQIVYALAEVYSMSMDLMDAQDNRVASLHEYTNEASKLVAALVADLPLSSPSEAPSEATAPAPEAKTGGSEAVQNPNFAVGDRVRHIRSGDCGELAEIHTEDDRANVSLDGGGSMFCRLSDLINLTRKEAIEAAGEASDKVLSSLNHQVGGNHYKDCSIQPVEFITANKLSFLEGCVVKRICRHRSKNGVEDLRKAIHEIELLIELEYGKEQP